MKMTLAMNQRWIVGAVCLLCVGCGLAILLEGRSHLLAWVVCTFLAVAVFAGIRASKAPAAGSRPSRPSAVNELPGNYVAYGISALTKSDGKWHGAADSALSARIQAEREGWVVKRVEREV